MHFTSLRDRLAGVIGNVLEHYDNALFAFLAPFIAPLFFNHQDPLTALILTYGMLPVGRLARPLGSLFFGWIGDRFGRREALFCTLLGMAFVTVGLGCLPTYREVGAWAPLLLAIGRMLQEFCAAGESTGGAIFVLEQTPPSKRSLIDGFYNASSMGGILIASGLVTFLSRGSIEESWRLLFWIGGATAFLGVFIRFKTRDGHEFIAGLPIPAKRLSLIQVVREHKSSLMAIIFASGFSYVTYAIPFTLMNGFVPLITSLTKTDVMQLNTVLLMVDMVLLPFFGYLADRFGKEKVMLLGALCSMVGAIPLFYCLEGSCLATVIAVRLSIVVFGVAFAAPYHAWAMEQVPPQHRYLILSLGAALGSLFIGTPTSAISLWLYQQTGWISAPAIYFLVAAMAAGLVVFPSLRGGWVVEEETRGDSWKVEGGG